MTVDDALAKMGCARIILAKGCWQSAPRLYRKSRPMLVGLTPIDCKCLGLQRKRGVGETKRSANNFFINGGSLNGGWHTVIGNIEAT